MATNLVDTIRGVISSDAHNDAAATALGESPTDTRRGLQAAVPALLAGLAHRASTPEGASAVHDLLGRSAAEGSVEKLAGGGDAREIEDRGHTLVGKIFGDRSGSVGEALATSSGVKSASASRLLALAAPMVMGVLGKEVISRGVSAGGLSQLFSTHKNAILADPHMPSGLAGALGQRDVSQGQEQVEGQVERQAEGQVGEPIGRQVGRRQMGGAGAWMGEQREKVTESASRFGRGVEHAAVPVRRPRRHFVLPMLAAAVIAIWAVVAARRGNQAPRMGVTARQRALPTALFSPAGTSVSLPNGKMLHVTAGGPEADLVHTVADPSVPLPRSFQFSNVKFDPGSATPAAEASEPIDSVATILQSFPSARVKIEGLSESRARAVKTMLVAKGASADQIDTTGAGQIGAPMAESEGQSQSAEIVLVNR